MKPEDDEPAPTDDELREAAALAAALAKDAGPQTVDAPVPGDALETASLLRHARGPLAVPPAHEPISAAQVASALDARRGRGRRRVRMWIATSVIVPGIAAFFVVLTLMRSTSEQALSPAPVVRPSAGLLAAQAEATRGGGEARAALARLDREMRAYRRQYHDGLQRRAGGAP